MSPLIRSLRDEFERSTLLAQLFIENRETEERIWKKVDSNAIEQMIKDAIEDLKKPQPDKKASKQRESRRP